MRVHWLQHAVHEDLGCIGPWLAARGARVGMSCLPAGDPLPDVEDFDVLLVLGGPMNVYEEAEHPWLQAEKALIRAALAEPDKKLLGICLGAQLIADALGAPVTRNAHTEIGWFEVELEDAGRAHPWFAGWPDRFPAFHWHGDTFAIPPGADQLMRSRACAHQAYALDGRVLGLQFHLEVTAADAHRWYAINRPAAEAYVQEADTALPRLDLFALDNRLMQRLLDRFLAPAA